MKHIKGQWSCWQRESEKGTNFWRIRTVNDSTAEATLCGGCGKDIAYAIAALPNVLIALKAIEWTPTEQGELFCPYCGNFREHGHGGHCVIDVALKKARGEA